MRFLSFVAATLITPAVLSLALLWRGPYLLLVPLVLFVVVPLADHVLPRDTWNPDETAPPWPLPYRMLAWSWLPVQTALLAWGLYDVATLDLPGWERLLLVADLGIVTGSIGITFAHELMHRSSRFDRALAEVLMAQVGYTWFCIEHVYGHHKHVATPLDPASARRGESLYAFLPRTLVGGLRSAIALERARATKRGLSPLDPRHRLTRYALGLLALQALLWAWLGVAGWLAWLGHAAVAVVLLETINYLEHYGLSRRALPGRDGGVRYERVAPKHSWNSAHTFSNHMLLNLARHADHHAVASRSFETLRHIDDAPQLPTGYGGMFLLSFVPPLFRALVHPRLDAWQARAGREDDGEPTLSARIEAP